MLTENRIPPKTRTGGSPHWNDLALVQDFSRAIRPSTTTDGLRALLCETVKALGFDYFILIDRARRLRLTDYLPVVADTSAAHREDTILFVAKTIRTPFLWSDIPRFVALDPHQRASLDLGRDTGLGAGFTVPIHHGDGFGGLFSVMTRRERIFPLAAIPAAHHIAAIAFRPDAIPAQAAMPAPALTPRQFDCAVLVAQGKSDWEIGKLLGISESTVHKHIEDAKRRYGVSTRIQLIVRTLFDNRLTFSDVLSARPSQATGTFPKSGH